MIPKIIHQIWMQGWENLPADYIPFADSVVANNPRWTIMRWDDKGIRQALQDYSCQIGDTSYLDKYNAFTLLHQRVDFARYFLLYIYGGVSVDVDAKSLKGFDTLPQLSTSDFIVSKNSSGAFINNATILVSAQNPLMKEFLDGINTSCDNYLSNMACIQNTTGPTTLTSFVNVHLDKIDVLDNSYMEPCSGMDKSCQVQDMPVNAILDHQHAGTWVPPAIRNLAITFHFCKRNWILIIVMLLLIILLVKILK